VRQLGPKSPVPSPTSAGTLAILLLMAATAQAQEEKQMPKAVERRAEADTARDFVRLAFNFYDQSDGGGNEHLKEDMTVLEPQILVSKAIGEKWTGTVKLQADIISAASVDKRYRFAPGTQSGASGDKFFGIDAGAFYAWSDQTTIGAGVSFSTEYDYRSLGAYAKWTYSTASKNDTFVVKASGYFDTLDLILFDGSEPGTDDRRSLSLGLGWSHVIGPRTVGTVNWDVTSQSGFLSTPYNSVVAAGTEVQEVLPDSRLRNAFHVRVRHLLVDDLAIEGGLGAYFDDWGATAFNVELAVHWEAIPEVLILRPSYRFHAQTEVDSFVSDGATSIPEERTQDSDLASFTSHTFGLKAIFPHARFLSDDMELEIGLDFTIRSDGLDSFGVTVGYVWRY